MFTPNLEIVQDTMGNELAMLHALFCIVNSTGEGKRVYFNGRLFPACDLNAGEMREMLTRNCYIRICSEDRCVYLTETGRDFIHTVPNLLRELFPNQVFLVNKILRGELAHLSVGFFLDVPEDNLSSITTADMWMVEQCRRVLVEVPILKHSDNSH